MIPKENGGPGNNQPPGKVTISPSAWKTLAILSSIATMAMYAETMLIPAIPDLIQEFNISYSTSSWILSAYLVVGAVMTPITGKLSDMYGKKKMLLVTLIFYAVGVSLGGFSTSIYMLLFARALQGVGMSIFPIAFGIVRDQFPREKLAIGQGVISSMFAAGAVIGLLAGGSIIQNFGWRVTFYSIIPVIVALIFVIRRFVHVEERPMRYLHADKTGKPKEAASTSAPSSGRMPASAMDIKGIVTLAGTIVSFLLALTFMESGGITSMQITAFLAAGSTSLVLFILVERKARSPLVDFRLMLHQIILPSNVMITIVGLCMFMVFQTIPVLVRSPPPSGFGGDAFQAANIQLPFALVFLVFGPTSGFIISKWGSVKPTVLGSIIMCAGFFALVMLHSTPLMVSANLAVISTGLSLTNVGVMNINMLSTPREFMGISLGMNTLFRIVGSSIGPAVAGMFMQVNRYAVSSGGTTNFFPSAESYYLIFITAAVVSVTAAVLAFVLKSRIRTRDAQEARI
jgi:MFS family permease